MASTATLAPGDPLRMPGDAGEIAREIRVSFAAGVALVRVGDPVPRTVAVHQPNRTGRIFVEGESLDGEGVVPGFSLPVAEVLA